MTTGADRVRAALAEATPERVAALLPARDLDPRLVARLVQPGRVRDLAWRTWGAMLADPPRANGILRDALRAARHLHSRERRPVADLLHDLARLHGALRPLHGEARDPAAASWWLLAVHHGVPIDEARETWQDAVGGAPPDLDAATTLDRTLSSRWRDAGTGALAQAAGVPEAAAVGLVDALGPEVWDFLAASAARAPVSVRVDARRASSDDVLARLRAAGVEAEASPIAPHGLRLPPRTDLRALPRAIQAVVEPQDDASQLVAELVPPDARRVLDLCAGAGGKTLSLAARSPGATLWATDVRGRALSELQRRARRDDVAVQTALLRDGRPDRDLGGLFDVVVVDAPCTGTGVWRRHPAWRLRLREDGGPTDLQDAVLDQGASRVAPGGLLVYATCSVLPEEDEARIAAFAERHPDFALVPVSDAAPHLSAAVRSGPFLRTFPHRHGADGFFAAVLRRDVDPAGL